MNQSNRETEILICECSSPEHQIIFSYFIDDDVPEVYMSIHLTKGNFWQRLKYSIRYLFGYQCRFGAFDEIILDPLDAQKLDKISNYLKTMKK